MARESDARRDSRKTIQQIAESIIADDPGARWNPLLASWVMDQLVRRHRSTFDYLKRYSGNVQAEVSAVLDATVRADRRRGF